MKLHSSSRRQGIALVIVMLVITVLTILATGFAYSMKVEMRLARVAGVESEFEWLGRSGVAQAVAVLTRQAELYGQEPDALYQIWAGGPGRVQQVDTLGSENASPFGDTPLRFETDYGGVAETRIVDLERKFNINMADQRVMQQAMTLIGVDAGTSPMIVDSILDWIDRDDDEHVSGTESEFYRRLDPPYEAKNGPVDDLSELLLIRGMTPEIFWGTSSSGHRTAAFQMKDRFSRTSDQPIEYPMGMNDLFTPLSSGKVNINTAPASTLQLIPGVETNIAAEIIRHRSGLDGQDGTADDVPFSNPGELATVIPAGMAVAQLSQYCDVRSSAFEVTVECSMGEFRRTYVALLQRVNQNQVRVLSFYWKPPSADGRASGSASEGQPAASW